MQSYVAVLKYLTISRLNSLPFNTPSTERHLAQFSFIVPIASGIAGSIGYIAWKQVASGKILGKYSASSDSVEISQSQPAIFTKS